MALAGVLRVVRAHKGWSVEHAAEAAESNHMSWRRMEAGVGVRAATYGKVESLFHLPRGAVQRALGDDEAMVDLARTLGVDTTEAVDTGSTRWVVRFALAFGPQPESESVGVAEPVIVQVADVVSRWAAEKNRSKAKEDALQALLRVMPELAS